MEVMTVGAAQLGGDPGLVLGMHMTRRLIVLLVGPWLVTRDEVPDPQNLKVWLEVDGQRRQPAEVLGTRRTQDQTPRLDAGRGFDLAHDNSLVRSAASLEGSGGIEAGKTKTGSLVIQTPRGNLSLVRIAALEPCAIRVSVGSRYSAAMACSVVGRIDT
jgi:hypothetical protein